MARHFTAASTEVITCAVGAAGFAFGPGTIAAVVRTASDPAAQRSIFSPGLAPSTTHEFYLATTSGTLRFYSPPGVADLGVGGLLAAQGWALVAITKTTGGVVPRGHKYIYSTDTWTHANSATSLNDTGVAVTSVLLGKAGNADWWDGDIAAVGIWNVVLTDVQIESLAHNVTNNGWNQYAGLKALWILDQTSVAATLTDLTGNGADQTAITGTTIVSDTPNLVPPLPFVAGQPLIYLRKNV